MFLSPLAVLRVLALWLAQLSPALASPISIATPPVRVIPLDTWVYIVVVFSLGVSLALLAFARGTFTRWRRQSTLFRVPRSAGLIGATRFAKPAILEVPKRCALRSAKSRLKPSGILIGLLGSPTWEITGVRGWALCEEGPSTMTQRNPVRNISWCHAESGSKYSAHQRSGSLPASERAIFELLSNSDTPSFSPPPKRHAGSSSHYSLKTLQIYPLSKHSASGSVRSSDRPSLKITTPGKLSKSPVPSQNRQRESSLTMCHHSTTPTHMERTLPESLNTTQEHGCPRASTSRKSVDYAARSVRLVGSFEGEPSNSSSNPSLHTRNLPAPGRPDINPRRDSLQVSRLSHTLPSQSRRLSLGRPNRSPTIGPSPLRTMILPLSSSEEVSAYLLSEETYTPSNSQSSSSPCSVRRSRDSQPTLGGDRSVTQNNTPSSPRHSPRNGSDVRHSAASSTVHEFGALDDLIHQLVQATSEWDDSLFLSTEFKSLIETSKGPTPPATPPQTQRRGVDEEWDGIFLMPGSCPSLYFDTDCYSYELPRLPLFSIPEEEVSDP